MLQEVRAIVNNLLAAFLLCQSIRNEDQMQNLIGKLSTQSWE
jgi:hypothetical protein